MATEPKIKKIPLVELFGPTIQGEGAVIGQQTYFLRFGLCDYKCTMCDSMHAVDPIQVKANAEWLTQEEIFEKLGAFIKGGTTNWVTYSGGNPCIHDLTDLTRNLLAMGYNIAVETQGTFCPDWLLSCQVVTVSPKGPGMGEHTDLGELDEFIRKMYPTRLQTGLNMKVVVFDQRDLEFAAMLCERYCLGGLPYGFGALHFYLSLGNPYPPGDTYKASDYKVRENVIDLRNALFDKYLSLLEDIQHHPVLCNVKFLPQLHVLLWGNKQGV